MTEIVDKDFEFIDKIDSGRSVISRYRPNILYIEYKPGDDELDVDFAKKQMSSVRNICQYEPHHLIVDFRNTDVTFSAEARAFFAEDEAHNAFRLSQLIIINSLAHKLIANFYMRFNKPKSPTVIVNSLDDALKWLKKRI